MAGLFSKHLATVGDNSHQLLRNVLVEDILHRQDDVDFVAELEERLDLLPMNLVAADVRRLILIPPKQFRDSSPRLLQIKGGRRSRVRRARAVRFPAGANVAQAFGHDAQAWAKYQCQPWRANFQGTADDSPSP